MALDRNKKIGVFVAVTVAVVVFLFVSRSIFSTDSLNSAVADISASNTDNTSLPSESGLVVEDIIVGQGVEVKAGDLLTVHYTGVLADGTKFDSSLDRGVPIEFALGRGQVIAGWDKGLVGMKVGGVRTLVISPELGYGANTVGPIPANSTLTFQVELLGVETP